MPDSISRRRFALGSASAVLAAGLGGLGFTRSAHAVQGAYRPYGSRGAAGPGWLPREGLLQEVPRLLELASVPGVAIAVVDGQRQWQHGFGVADREKGRAVGTETVFEGASLGKPLFAYAVLRLRDAGGIDLARPLYDYLPLPEAANTRARRITARHVLTQTTGLPNWRLKPGPLQPEFEPGDSFSYSGEGVFYLQRVVEQLTGQSLERFMTEQVFRPLGMTSSSFVWSERYEPRMAAGYDTTGSRLDVYADIGRSELPLAGKWGRPMADWRYEDAERALRETFPHLAVVPIYMVPNAAGSLLTTASDYARFMAKMLAGPAGGLELSERSWREMLTRRVNLNSALSWGTGWALQHDEGGDYFWHWGANGTFRNFVIGDPRNGRGIVVFSNSTNGPKIYQRVVTELTGRDHPAFLWFQV